ncbi:MAG: hypothetical protein FWF02_14695 [Micrococcales bacterium]|nr:hypothetical protein [Micrococcales bacterium]MCL2668927.1 hypothetical protein [Micrococcales bacterium]
MRRALVVGVALVFLLVGCGSGGDDATDDDTLVEATWPTDCKALGAPGTRSAFFADSLPVDQAEASPTPLFDGATTMLWCEWLDGDVNSLTVVFATGEPEDVDAAVDSLIDEGYECTDDFDGWLCTSSMEGKMTLEDGSEAPLDLNQTVYASDDVWVSIELVWVVKDGVKGEMPTFMEEIIADLYE